MSIEHFRDGWTLVKYGGHLVWALLEAGGEWGPGWADVDPAREARLLLARAHEAGPQGLSVGDSYFLELHPHRLYLAGLLSGAGELALRGGGEQPYELLHPDFLGERRDER